jgi:hypothetical protein
MMVPKGGLEPPRVTSHAPQTCASTSSATSACLGRSFTNYFEGSGDAVDPVDVGTAAGAATEGVGCGVGVAAGACSGIPDCKTELVPLMNGSDKQSAISMNDAAAPIVIFASNVCVPRGPNAVLETELENNAPASALPGCNNTHRTRTMQDRMNNP